MKKYILSGLMAACMAFSFTACQQFDYNLPNPNTTESMIVGNDTTYVTQFQRVWQGIDVGYAFWRWEQVDWDAVYDEYLPVFEEADRRHQQTGEPGMTMDEYRATWKRIICPLIDHHMMFVSYRPDDPSKERLVLRPSDARRDSADYHRAFTLDEHIKCLQTMFNEGQLSGHLQWATTTDASNAQAYVIDGMFATPNGDSVAYFYISSFMIYYPLHSMADSACTVALNRWLKRIIGHPEVATIFDTRNNGGGWSAWKQNLGQFFTNEDFYNCIKYVKAGPDRLDYMPRSKNWIHSLDGIPTRQFTADHPFLCLFDQHSVSNGEEIPWMFSYLPGYASVGERTCGGMGELYSDNYNSTYSGTFGNSKLCDADYRTSYGNYYVYMSTVATVDAKTGQSLEGVGMIPQVECVLDTAQFFAGKCDNQLLRALQYISNKQ